MTDEPVARFWRRFRALEAARRFARPALHDSFSIGSTADSADEGARLVLAGLKIATSCLARDCPTPPGPPFVAALSVLHGGVGQAVAEVETGRVCDTHAGRAR